MCRLLTDKVEQYMHQSGIVRGFSFEKNSINAEVYIGVTHVFSLGLSLFFLICKNKLSHIGKTL